MNDNENKKIRNLVREMLSNKQQHMDEENKKELAIALRKMSNLEYPYEFFRDTPPIILEIWNLSAFYLDGKEN